MRTENSTLCCGHIPSGQNVRRDNSKGKTNVKFLSSIWLHAFCHDCGKNLSVLSKGKDVHEIYVTNLIACIAAIIVVQSKGKDKRKIYFTNLIACIPP